MPDWDTDWLRTVAARGYTTICDKPASSLLSEAADEIDRLRELLTETSQLLSICSDEAEAKEVAPILRRIDAALKPRT